MAQLFSLSGQTLVDGNGAPYALAKANFYLTGTTTPQNTWSDAGLTTPNANPVVADANGRFPDIYLAAARYKVVLTTSANVTIDTLDPVDGTLQIIAASSAPATTYPFLRYHNTTDGRVYRRNSANSAWLDEGPVDSLISGASVSEVLTGTATDKAVTPDSLAGIWQRGTDIASASTLSLPATGGGVFNVTGTTGITGISSAQGGRCVNLRFASGLTLTHNGTSLVLPGAANLTVRAGDIVEFTNEAAADASGSNWRATNIVFNNNVPQQAPLVGSKTTNYTVTDADRGALIRFSGLSADATLTLPAASGRAGFMLYVVNDDTNDTTGYGVIIDPNASELIDGLSTRKMYTGSRVTLLCDGTGWRTVLGTWRYFSGDQTITTNTTLALTHNLGIKPKRVWGELKCTTIDNGYAVGDYIPAPIWGDNSNVNSQCAPQYDATSINVIFSQTAQVFWSLAKGTRADVALTNGSWKLRIYAED